MAKERIEYIDPGPHQHIPVGLRLRGVLAIIKESIRHPRTISYIIFDPENDQIVIQRERQPKPESKR